MGFIWGSRDLGEKAIQVANEVGSRLFCVKRHKINQIDVDLPPFCTVLCLLTQTTLILNISDKV